MSELMKAAVMKGPGEIAVVDVPRPEPGAGEVLLKVDMAALCGTDQRVLRGEKAVAVPIIGHEIAGTAVAVGAGVDTSLIGGRFAVQTVVGCGRCPACLRHHQIFCIEGFKAIGYAWNGGFAEYMIMPEPAVQQGCLIPMPDAMTAAEGTLLEPLSCCINGLRYLPLEEMERVVIMGAGVIGALNGLVAKARGVREVIIINRSASKLDILRDRNLPFDHLVHANSEEAVEWVRQHTGGQGVNGVVVSASAKELVNPALRMLALGGHVSLFAGFDKANPLEAIDLNLIHYRELHVHGANSSVRRDYEEAIALIRNGAIDADALITHTFSLDRFVEAMQAQSDPRIQSLKVLIQPGA